MKPLGIDRDSSYDQSRSSTLCDQVSSLFEKMHTATVASSVIPVVVRKKQRSAHCAPRSFMAWANTSKQSCQTLVMPHGRQVQISQSIYIYNCPTCHSEAETVLQRESKFDQVSSLFEKMHTATVASSVIPFVVRKKQRSAHCAPRSFMAWANTSTQSCQTLVMPHGRHVHRAYIFKIARHFIRKQRQFSNEISP